MSAYTRRLRKAEAEPRRLRRHLSQIAEAAEGILKTLGNYTMALDREELREKVEAIVKGTKV